MNHQKMGLLLTSLSLVLFSCVLPFFRSAGPAANGAHFVTGLALGTGSAMVIASLVKRRFRSPCER